MLENDDVANLYKKPVPVTDPKTGQKVKAKSKKWWGRYRDENGVEKRVPLAADKTAAQVWLNELVRKAERKAAGIEDLFEEHRKRPLVQHIDAFRLHLIHKGSTTNYVNLTVQRIRDPVAACKFERIDQISAERVQGYLAELRKGGRSIATSNHYLRAIKMLTRWLVRNRRASDDRLISLSLLNGKADIRHERRTLMPEELERLLAAAKQGTPFRGLTGEDRFALYLVALNTGLRAGELASLKPQSFDLDGHPPTVTVEAAYSKHRRRDVLPIRPDLATRIREYLMRNALACDQPLWPGTWSCKASAKMLRIDLAAAEIPYRDTAGRVFDFHSLRHQFISNLARGGEHPKEAQALARHSTITLTMDRYSHLGIMDLSAALTRLPQLAVETPDEERESLRATGTDGRAEEVPAVVPSGAEIGAERAAPQTIPFAPDCTEKTPSPQRDDGVRVYAPLRTNPHRPARGRRDR
jgi:integrase